MSWFPETSDTCSDTKHTSVTSRKVVLPMSSDVQPHIFTDEETSVQRGTLPKVTDSAKTRTRNLISCLHDGTMNTDMHQNVCYNQEWSWWVSSFSNTFLELICVLTCFYECRRNGFAAAWNWPGSGHDHRRVEGTWALHVFGGGAVWQQVQGGNPCAVMLV